MNNSELLFYAEKHQHINIFLFSNKKIITMAFDIMCVCCAEYEYIFCKYEHQNTSFKCTLFIPRRTKVFIYCNETLLCVYLYKCV